MLWKDSEEPEATGNIVGLDGHDRLLAALEEDVLPELQILTRHEPDESLRQQVREAPWRRQVQKEAGMAYEHAMVNRDAWGPRTVDRLNEKALQAWSEAGLHRASTVAWPVADGWERWRGEIESRLEDLDERDLPGEATRFAAWEISK